MIKKYIPIFALLIFHLFLLLNLQFTAWPEMFSFPLLRNEGYLLYGNMVHPYPPLLPTILGLIYSVFGYNLLVLQVFTWTLIILADVLIFLIILKITKSRQASLIAVFIYAVLQSLLEGNMLWYDTALVVPLLAGLFFIFQKSPKTLFISGFCFGLASLLKQTGGLFVLLSLVIILTTNRRLRNIWWFMLPIILMWGLVFVNLYNHDNLMWFWNWVVKYPTEFWTTFPGYIEMSLNSRQVSTLLILMSPLLLLYRNLSREHMFISLYFLIGLVAVYPRFSFFHFQPALAFLVILYGAVWSLQKNKRFLLIGLALLFWLLIPTFKSMWHKDARFYSDKDIQIGKIIKEKTNNSKNIYLLGVPSSYYLFSESLPPKPWLDNYGWYFEVEDVADKTISNWEKNPPEYVLWQDPKLGKWYELGVYNPRKVLNWIKNYYQEVDSIDGNIKLLKRK